MRINYRYSIVQYTLNRARVKEKLANDGRDYYRGSQTGGRYMGGLDNNAQINLDDHHVSSFVPPLAVTRTPLKRGSRNPRRFHSFASR